VTASNDLIGPYRVISQLGAGAMGEVWRARDERLDRYVALKVLPADASGDPERRARMVREARAAAAIRHPNVVTLFDILTEDGNDVLVMELVEGRTLSETLRKEGPPPLEVALRWIDGVVQALVAAHARGVLHRDIKSANVMVTADGVKVLDFGLAKLKGDDAPSPIAGDREPTAATSNTRLALDATMPSTSNQGAGIDSYKTHAGQLLGTPLYMAPEQIEGALPDERSEVFSVGVLAHEILRGKPPYTATTMDALFRQISTDEPPPLPKVPAEVVAIVERALAKDPAARWPSMEALHAALHAERTRMFAPPARRWPLVAAVLLLAVGGGIGAWAWNASRPAPARPGDDLVTRALGEYDVFYNDKALSSLRAALAIAPEHPRANAYMILFGGASDIDRANAVDVGKRVRTAHSGKDRALLDAAVTLVEEGPVAARKILGTPTDRELAFWAAELDYRAASYAAARDAYQALLADPAKSLRGRIYDHYSAVLLYFDDPLEALRIGTLYRDAFPGEADAVAVYATTLSAAGRHAEAITAAEEAVRLAEGEDTHAGLAKVLALAGDRARAKQHYRESLGRAGASRRPIRRAALAMLHLIDGEIDAARDVTAPCLSPTDPEGLQRERGACVFMAGIVDPALADRAAAALDALASETTPVRPPYGSPASLARLVRARAKFFGGACVIDAPPSTVDAALADAYSAPLDFYAAYHVPFFATWQVCEHAALLAASGDRTGAAMVLRPVAEKAQRREWLLAALRRYEP
jgi:tetratricopeptide (TPR) repeat protein